MARPLRVEYPGAWYHVLNRGRRKENIFIRDADRQDFLKLIGECFRLYELEVHAYSLMPNHYHLLIHTPRGNLSRIMRHLDGVYTQKINRRYKLEGSLFKGRFKSILIEEESYLLELVRYIHRNPLKAGLERKLGDHKWTSHRAYMIVKDRPVWLQTDSVLMRFSQYENNARKGLQSFVKKEVSQSLEKRLYSINWPAVLGGKLFKEKVKERLLERKIEEREVPQYKECCPKRPIREVVNILEKKCGVNPKFLKRRRDRSLTLLKRAFIYNCREKLEYSYREISEIMGGITFGLITKQYHLACREIERREGCCKEVERIAKCLK